MRKALYVLSVPGNQFNAANAVAHFSRQYSVGNFAEPLFAEIGVSVIVIKVGSGKYHPIGIVMLVCFIVL